MATTLSDLLVRLDLDSAKFRDGIEQANRSLNKLNDRVDQMGSGMSATIFKSIAAWDLLQTAMSGVFQFLQHGIKEFVEAEQASNQLSAQLRQLGYDTEALLEPLEAQTKAIAGSTLATEEQAKSMFALLATAGAAPASLDAVSRAVLDYAALTGKDATRATRTLSDEIESAKPIFDALGITFTKTGNSAKDFAKFAELANEKFGGAAQAQAAGMAGKIDQMGKAWDDLAEAFGGFIANAEASFGILQGLAANIRAVTFAMFGDEGSAEARNELVEQIKNAEQALAGMKKTAEGGGILGGLVSDDDIAAFERQLDRLRADLAAFDAKAGGGAALPGAVSGGVLGEQARRKEMADAERRKKVFEEAARKDKAAGDAASKAAMSKAERDRASIKALTERFDPETQFRNARARIQELIEKGLAPEIAQKAIEDAYRQSFEALGAMEAENMASVNAAFIDSIKEAGKPLEQRPPEEAVESFAQKFNRFMGDAAKVVGDALAAAAMSFASAVGGGAELVANAAVQAASGNWIAAIVDVLTTLFSNFDGFNRLIEQSVGMLMRWVNVLTPTFTALVDALQPLLGAVSTLVAVVLDLVSPILNALIPILDSLTPILMVVAMLLAGLKPIFEFVALVIKGVALVLDVLLRGVFILLQGVGLALLAIVYALATAWNAIVSMWEFMLNTIAKAVKIVTFGAVDFTVDLSGAKVNVDNVSDAMAALVNTTFDAATAQADNTAAVDEATGAVKEMSDSLLNVPSIFKVVAARFRVAAPTDLRLSQDLGIVPHFAEGGLVRRTTLALVGEGGEQEIVSPESMMRAIVREEGGGDTFIFNVVAGTGRELYEQFKRFVQRDSFTQTGFTVQQAG